MKQNQLTQDSSADQTCPSIILTSDRSRDSASRWHTSSGCWHSPTLRSVWRTKTCGLDCLPLIIIRSAKDHSCKLVIRRQLRESVAVNHHESSDSCTALVVSHPILWHYWHYVLRLFWNGHSEARTLLQNALRINYLMFSEEKKKKCIFVKLCYPILYTLGID